MEGVEPLSPDKSFQRSFLIDDVPVPSPKKDFNALLEERLKDSTAVFNADIEKPVTKFPFLRKGQGLARYQPNPLTKPKIRIRSRSLPLSANIKCPTTKSLKNNVEKQKVPVKTLKSTPIAKTVNFKPLVAQQKLFLKDESIPKKKLHSRSLGGISSLHLLKNKEQMNASSDLNSSDPEMKTRRELEEVRIFELLEEKAENSSFSSTSSAVMAFLHQSSPLKSKIFLQSIANGKQNNVNADNSIEEHYQGVVYTAKSNFVSFGSHTNDEEGFLQWNSHPTNSNTKLSIQNQWENLLDLDNKEAQHAINDRNDNLPLKVADSQEIICALPYGTDVEKDNEKMDEENEANTSLHVRFSEFNEYKTFGLSDVSTISNDSRTGAKDFDNQAWSDGSATSDSSDIETLSSNLKALFKKSELDRKCNYFENKTTDMSDDELSSTKSFDDDEECSSKASQEEEDTLLEINYDEEASLHLEEENSVFFKSELLKNRLSELEREIDIFRKENAALASQRKILEDERIQFRKQMKEREEKFELEKKRIESHLEEERKKMAREKTALDSRLKDAREKAQRSKQEREQIQNLKEELQELKSECYEKENKWQAAQGRRKSQLRVLQAENAKLKQEVERLQKLRNPKTKKPICSNTKSIHKINKLLNGGKKALDDELVEMKSEQIIHENSTESHESVYEDGEKTSVDPESIEKRRDLYKNLLRDATMGYFESQEAKKKAEEQCKENKMSDAESRRSSLKCNDDNTHVKEKSNSRSFLNESRECDDVEISETSRKCSQQNIKEIRHPDGHIEIFYPNHNVKKIYPDKNFAKTVYYNGDVQEKYKDGRVKYYYAALRTWHTTMPDGLEILEFPDGQVERRSKNGTTEVSYPDGSVRIKQSDGTEKWALPDGTLAETSMDGDKVFKMTNGQVEIHTKDHKKRVYPDGTVKLVYHDGTQETRYANGRVRLKDKDGNLLMDSYK